MAASLYKNYLRLLEKWGVDVSKKGRDLGEFIRQQVLKEFSQGEASNIKDLKDCERKYQCLNRLVNNHYGNLYKRRKEAEDVSASGLTLSECKQVMSNSGLQALKDDEAGLLLRMKRQLIRS